MPCTTPHIRVAALNDRPVHPDGDYVLYWMIANRRARWSFSLQRAIERARELGKPLIVLEALRVGYRWASDRIHRFIIDGMADNLARFEGTPVAYHPYLEERAGDGRGLLEALADRACVVVTDEFPCFFLPRMVRAAGDRLPVRLEQVDSNGILPLRATDRVFTTAHAFRRHLHKTVGRRLPRFPLAEPLAHARDLPIARLPADILARWPGAAVDVLEGRDAAWLRGLPIDHEVRVTALRGGSIAGERRARDFLTRKLSRYADDRNQPQQDVASGLSPYLHFGHVSAHEVVASILERESWHEGLLAMKASGSRRGWWGMSEPAEAFLDQLITWREVGYAFTFHRPRDYDRYESLPAWALATLEEHAVDPRAHLYTLDELERAQTHDPLWNAAQNQLRREGRIHNYLRMLWGKKILQWTPHPRDALDALIHLNNRWALDGRNPNSYSGVLWTLGRFDRAWGPERPVFGKVRYMTSENTARKVRVKDYIRQHTSP